jgi:Fe2+ transport system protein FeoA
LDRTVEHSQRPTAAGSASDDLRLGDIPLRQTVELTRIDLPADEVEPLLERGVLPGCRICPVRSSPSGDPIVPVDGSLIALRRETAACLCVRLLNALQEAS